MSWRTTAWRGLPAIAQETRTSVSTPRITVLASRPATRPGSRERATDRSDGGPGRRWSPCACPSGRGTPSWLPGSAPPPACPCDPRETSGCGSPRLRHGEKWASCSDPIWDSYIGQEAGVPKGPAGPPPVSPDLPFPGILRQGTSSLGTTRPQLSSLLFPCPHGVRPPARDRRRDLGGAGRLGLAGGGRPLLRLREAA